MELNLKPIFKYSYLKRLSFGILLVWAVSVSCVLILNRPQFVILLQDQTGIRRVPDEAENQQAEQLAFVKDFAAMLYRYSSTTYSSRVERAKQLMASELRDSRKLEFERVSEKLKANELVQCFSRERGKFDIRFLDKDTYELDLQVHDISGLVEEVTPLKVELRLQKRNRTIDNWNAWEVKSYDEHQGQSTQISSAGSTVR